MPLSHTFDRTVATPKSSESLDLTGVLTENPTAGGYDLDIHATNDDITGNKSLFRVRVKPKYTSGANGDRVSLQVTVYAFSAAPGYASNSDPADGSGTETSVGSSAAIDLDAWLTAAGDPRS